MLNILAEGYQLEVTWGLVASVFGGFVLCIGALTVAAWKVWTTWKGLQETHGVDQEKRDKEDCERKEKLAEQDSEIRESLLNRYKQMYELEKERGSREMQSVTVKIEKIEKECAEWDDKYRKLRNDYDQLKDKYDKVVQLNIQYQQDKAKDTAEIDRLTKSLNELRRQVDILDPNKHTET